MDILKRWKQFLATSPPCPHPEDYVTWEQQRETEFSTVTHYRRQRAKTVHLCVNCGIVQKIEYGPWGNWFIPDFKKSGSGW